MGFRSARRGPRYFFFRPFPGDTTPMETTYFSASSTLMSSSITSALGIIRKKPEVGLGVVGT